MGGLEEFGRRRGRYVAGSAPEYFRPGENARGMDGQRECANIQREGNIQECGNYRGIKMISHIMKIWERIIDRRLREETSMGEEQFGFMPGEGQLIPYFAARQVIEKHREMQKELHLVFIDLENAYDRVQRQEVWRCLKEQGVHENYVRLVKYTYEDARTQVKTSIGLTSQITVRVGLHQGSSLIPYLFDMILDVMGRGIKEQPPGVCCLQTISCCAVLEETM